MIDFVISNVSVDAPAPLIVGTPVGTVMTKVRSRLNKEPAI